MSRHPWPARLLRAFLAFWFVFFGGELGAVHGCPMHDRPLAAAHGPAGVMPHASAHESHEAAHRGGAPASSGGCSCSGSCSAAPPAVTLSTPPTVRLAQLLRRTVPAIPQPRIVAVGAGAHVLPFANGPPVVAQTA